MQPGLGPARRVLVAPFSQGSGGPGEPPRWVMQRGWVSPPRGTQPGTGACGFPTHVESTGQAAPLRSPTPWPPSPLCPAWVQAPGPLPACTPCEQRGDRSSGRGARVGACGVPTPVPALRRGWVATGEDLGWWGGGDAPARAVGPARQGPSPPARSPAAGQTRPDSDPVYLGPVLAQRPEPTGSSLRSASGASADVGPAAPSGARGCISWGEGVESVQPPPQALV